MSSNEVKVGALTLGGIGLLAGIITFLGAFSFSGSGYKLQISYPQVGGLMPGHVVRYAGVQVGTVKEVNVNGDSVDVVADINKDIKIPKGAVFSLGSDGILGERFVDVLPPVKMTGQYIHPGDKLEGEQGTGLDEFMNASSKVLAKVEGIAEALNNVFGDPEVQRSMRDGFVNARDISNNMNTFTKVMADVAVANQQEINLMVQQMSEMAVRMNNAASQMENSWLRQIRVALDRIWQESLKILLMPAAESKKPRNYWKRSQQIRRLKLISKLLCITPEKQVIRLTECWEFWIRQRCRLM